MDYYNLLQSYMIETHFFDRLAARRLQPKSVNSKININFILAQYRISNLINFGF